MPVFQEFEGRKESYNCQDIGDFFLGEKRIVCDNIAVDRDISD